MDRRPQYRVGLHGLADQRRIIGNVAIHFDEHGLWPRPIEETRQQVPTTRAHRRSIGVDRDGTAHIVVLDRMSRDVDFPDQATVDSVSTRNSIAPSTQGRYTATSEVTQHPPQTDPE